MRSAAEAGAYLRALKQLVQYVGASDASMEEGSLRVDANVSTRPRGDTALGTKTEIKNMNSFSAVERALEAEFARQCAVLASGGRVEQQTLLWDQARNEVRPARTKEGSHDYRYFPEPDLPPLVLSVEWIDGLRAGLPELPAAKRTRFAAEYALGAADVDVLTADPLVADYFEGVARQHGDAKTAANWVMRDVLATLKDARLTMAQLQLQVRPADLARLLGMVRDGAVSHPAAAKIFQIMVRTAETPDQIAEEAGLIKIDDEGQTRAWIGDVLAEHPEEARRFAAGERKLQGVLVGLVMRKSAGRADPKLVNRILAEPPKA
jgi:aspartyl-tRNA(Asn)/glutamyl-tRNA(Gln) amidotransferase subunit B